MKKFVIWTAIVFGVLICVSALAGLAFWSYSGFAKSSSDVGQQYADWQKNGLPTLASEIEGPPIPADTNAYLAFQAILDKQGGASKGVDLPKEISSNKLWDTPAAAQFLLERQPELNAIAAAAAKPNYQTSRNWDEGSWTLMPELACYKNWTKMLCADAERRAGAGDAKGAIDRLKTARLLARHASKEPTLIGYLVAVTIDRVILRSCGVTASALAEDSQFLLTMQKMLEQTAWAEDFPRTFRGEAYMMFATMRNMSFSQYKEMENLESEGPARPRNLQKSGLPKGILEKAVLAEHLRFWNEFYPRIAKGEKGRGLGKDMEMRMTAMEMSRSVPENMASSSVSIFSGVFTATERLDTERLAVDAYLHVLLHRNRTGQWPPTLTEAGVPAEKNHDYVTGSNLGYRISGKGMRVWHAGQNSRDDGGITRDEARAKGMSSSDSDAAFQYPWPKGANP